MPHDCSLENNHSNPPLPPFSKGRYLFSPFEKGGLRGIIFMHLCEPDAHDGSLQKYCLSASLTCHPEPCAELVSALFRDLLTRHSLRSWNKFRMTNYVTRLTFSWSFESQRLMTVHPKIPLLTHPPTPWSGGYFYPPLCTLCNESLIWVVSGKMIIISYGSFEMKISTFLRKIKIAVSIIECCIVSSDDFFIFSAEMLNFRATNWASSISSSENLLNLLIMKSNGWSTLISRKLSL